MGADVAEGRRLREPQAAGSGQLEVVPAAGGDDPVRQLAPGKAGCGRQKLEVDEREVLRLAQRGVVRQQEVQLVARLGIGERHELAGRVEGEAAVVLARLRGRTGGVGRGRRLEQPGGPLSGRPQSDRPSGRGPEPERDEIVPLERRQLAPALKRAEPVIAVGKVSPPRAEHRPDDARMLEDRRRDRMAPGEAERRCRSLFLGGRGSGGRRDRRERGQIRRGFRLTVGSPVPGLVIGAGHVAAGGSTCQREHVGARRLGREGGVDAGGEADDQLPRTAVPP